MDESKEKKLIKRIISKGDKKAADELVSAYYKEIYAFAYRQTGDVHLSMDLTQDIFISVLQTLAGYDSRRASFRTWLYRAASNKIVDYYRSRQYRMRTLTVDIEEYGSLETQNNVFEIIETKELSEAALEILSQIESQAQHIVRMKIYLCQSFAEIAVIVGLPEGTVKTKYYAALKTIRRELCKDDG